ncbi:MAG: hypothetical protein JWO48_1402 [Bryobacterales bacterium]|nr:hypothetical protein [Bryobacterales bacterium]
MVTRDSILKDGLSRLSLIAALTIGTFFPAYTQDLLTGNTVNLPVKADVSPRLEEMVARGPRLAPRLHVPPFRRIPVESPLSPQSDTAVQTVALPRQMFQLSTGLNFDGVGMGFPNYVNEGAPPDTNLSVGDTQVVQWVNVSFAIFDKATGAVIQGNTEGNALWTGFGGGCETNNDGDIIVNFDKAAHRWVFTQFSVTTLPNLQCLAISQTSDARGPYFRFSYSFGNTYFNDYPKLSVWSDAYYMSFNIFTGPTFVGPSACAIDRADALSGVKPRIICVHLKALFGDILPSDLDGSNPPPPGSPAYFVGFGLNKLWVFQFHPDFNTPGNTTFTGASVAVAPFSAACAGGGTCIRQAGTLQALDSLADRLMYRLAYRNFGDHESLVVNHSITPSVGASAIRWYELRIVNHAATLFQQGTFGPDSTARWMGSIAMDKAGNMALGYSASSFAIHPGIRITGRLATDPLGMMQPEAVIINGGGSQFGQRLSRWGDYSSMSVDPSDDCTFWYTNQYLKSNGAFNWSTRIATMKFPSCQ